MNVRKLLSTVICIVMTSCSCCAMYDIDGLDCTLPQYKSASECADLFNSAVETGKECAIETAKDAYHRALLITANYGLREDHEKLLYIKEKLSPQAQKLLPTLVADTLHKEAFITMALQYEFYDLLPLLIKYGADVNKHTKYEEYYQGATPLHQVATLYNIRSRQFSQYPVHHFSDKILGLERVARILLDAPGVNVNLVDGQGRTALQVAENSVIGDLIRQRMAHQ